MTMTISRKILGGFIFAFALLLLGGISSLSSTLRLTRTARAVQHSDEVLTALTATLTLLVDVETGSRGFALTGSADFLEPYNQGIAELPNTLTRLRQLLDGPTPAGRLAELERLARLRVERARQTIDLRRQQGLTSVAGLVANGEGKRIMDQARRVIAQLEAEEHRRLAERTAADKLAARWTYVVNASASLVGLLLMILGAVLLTRAVTRPVATLLVGVEKMAAGDLSVQVATGAPDELGRLAHAFNDMVRKRRDAQEELSRANGVLEGLFRASPIAIMGLDREGKVELWNPAAERIYGWKASEILGQRPRLVPPEEEADFARLVKEILVEGRAVGPLERSRMRKDGSRFDAYIIGAPRLIDGKVAGTIGFAEDITDRKRSEESLRQVEERFRLLVEGVQDYAILMLDPQGRVALWNSGAERIKGYRADEILGQSIARFYTPEDQAAGKPQADLASTAAHGRLEDDGWRVRKDGSQFYANVVLTALRDPAGALRGFADITRDLTKHREADLALRRAHDELEDRVVERTAELSRANDLLKSYAALLEKSNRELEQFAFVASHDMQEPMRKIVMFGERLRSREAGLDEQGRDYLRRMQNAAQRMQSLIQSLLDYARVATHAKPFVLVDLAKVIRDVTSDLELQIERTHATIEVGPLPEANVDETQIRQLFQNLIGNALKFRQEGRPPVVKIAMREPPSQPDTWEILVEDNGIGFDPQYSERIFGLFQRLHGRDSYPGTGIGLAICRKIAQRHGGNVTASSVLGQGATFVVTLARKQTEPTAAPAVGSPQLAPG